MMLQKSVKYWFNTACKITDKGTAGTRNFILFISTYPKSNHSNAFSPPPLPTLEKFSGDQNYGIIFCHHKQWIFAPNKGVDTGKNLIPDDSLPLLPSQWIPPYFVPNSHRSSSPSGKPYLLLPLDPGDTKNAQCNDETLSRVLHWTPSKTFGQKSSVLNSKVLHDYHYTVIYLETTIMSFQISF